MDILIRPLPQLPLPGSSTAVETISLVVGGCAANTAIALAQLDLPVGIWARVGQDALGDLLKQQLLSAGVTADLFIQDPTLATKAVALLVGPDGDRRLLRGPGLSNALSPLDLANLNLQGLGWLHIGGLYSLRRLLGAELASLLVQAQDAGVITSLDTVWTHDNNWQALLPLLPHLNYVMPSLAEAQQISGAEDPETILAFLLERGAKTVILKLGEAGSMLGTGNQRLKIPAYPVTAVVDTTGAGDAFCAGFIAARSFGLDLEQAMNWGNACGALTVQVSGANSGFTGRAQIEALVKVYSCPS
ncbi:carbohydrate kinase family protein [Leptolyngbya sp. FACHB-261]|nr:carbohydrate kinase family protein [Leptolyngbya sp. FACHB-261]